MVGLLVGRAGDFLDCLWCFVIHLLLAGGGVIVGFRGGVESGSCRLRQARGGQKGMVHRGVV